MAADKHKESKMFNWILKKIAAHVPTPKTPTAQEVVDSMDKNQLLELLSSKFKPQDIAKHIELNAIDIAEHINEEDIKEYVAENLDISAKDIAEYIEAEDIAEHISPEDIAGHISFKDIAEHIEIDAEDIAEHIRPQDIAEYISLDDESTIDILADKVAQKLLERVLQRS
jgi:hypothetical protein